MLMAVGYHQKDVKTKAYIMLNDALEVAIATERSFVLPPIASNPVPSRPAHSITSVSVS